MVMDLLAGVHLLLVDVGAGGPLLVAAMEGLDSCKRSQAVSWARHLLIASLIGLLIGSILGVAMGWYEWSSGLDRMIARMPSKVYYGIWEWFFSLVCICIQLAWWYWFPRAEGIARGLRAIIGVLGSTNLLYHFPVLFAVITELSHRGEHAGELLTAGKFRELLAATSAGPRALHAAIAAIGVSATWLLLLASWPRQPLESYWARWASRWIFGSTVAQWLVGFWVAVSLSPIASGRLLGENLWLSGGFAISLLLAFLVTQLTWGMSFGQATRRQAWVTAGTIMLLVLIMTWVSRVALAPLSSRSPEFSGSPSARFHLRISL